MTFDLVDYINRHKAFSEQTFGPGNRTAGVVAHIRKELDEVLAQPDDPFEWADIIILAIDGAWRNNVDAETLAYCLNHKLAINRARKWPDWRTVAEGQPICHIKE